VLLGLFDGATAFLLWMVSAVLFFGGQIPGSIWEAVDAVAFLGAALIILCNMAAGLYNRVWQYASAETAVSIALSTTVSQALAVGVARLLGLRVPTGVVFTAWLAITLAMCVTRFAWKLIRPALRVNGNGGARKRVLIYGAGADGSVLMQELRRDAQEQHVVVGFVDDDPHKRGAIIGVRRVLGTGEDLAALVRQHDVDEVFVAMPKATRAQIRRAYTLSRGAGVPVKVLPSLLETLENPGDQRVRSMDVSDLLGRELAPSSIRLHEDYLSGKTVLVTGAGGSIGGELCRQIAAYAPDRLILLGRGENRIHWIFSHLRDRHPEMDIIPVIGNVAVANSLERTLRAFRPQVVVHAAAHKHVYLMEHVPVEATRNNVLATAHLADLAENCGVERFIFISTDKAVAPTNIMGASKRMGELLLTCRPQRDTRFVCVRFGNVLGSEGSVLEIFKRQWQRCEPLTVTDPRATRYFISIPEACFLVLQAGALGQHGDIFLLDMGEPIRIVDLARDLITLQGGDPEAMEAVRFTGLRPGEKLHETLLNPNERIVPTALEHIGRIAADSGPQWTQIEGWLAAMRDAVESEDDERARDLLAEATSAEFSLGVEAVHPAMPPVRR